jgi:outer membrane lipoprotein SlyB
MAFAAGVNWEPFGRITMTIMTRRMVGASALAVLFAASFAAAQAPQPAPPQAPPPVRIRGTIDKVDGSMLTIKARDGNTVQVKLADNPRITAMVKATLADIKVGSFIGVTAMPQPDGSQKAIGLHIFMDAQRGVVPARFSPWDREPGSTMTNADVESTVAGVDGQTIMVKYPDGETKVIVPPNTPVVKFVPGDASDLKSGAQMIIVAAQKAPDGSLTAAGINVGRDGAAPPM